MRINMIYYHTILFLKIECHLFSTLKSLGEKNCEKDSNKETIVFRMFK